MHVGFVLQDDFPIDEEVRTRKAARTIHERGHDVTILARKGVIKATQGRRSADTVPYASVERFGVPGRPWLERYLTAPLPFNPFWSLWLRRQFARKEFDVVVVGDLRPGIPAILAARTLDVPVIVDLRENYPEFAKSIDRESPLDHVALHPITVGVLERLTVRLADHVWVMVPERTQALVEAGVPESKLTVVSNTPVLDDYDGASLDPPDLAPSDFSLVYVGRLAEYRGLDLVIDAVSHLLDADEDISLIVGGDGPHKDALERRCSSLGIEDHVVFTGWVDSDRVFDVMAAGDVGVIPHQVNRDQNTTVPNKLFDYMLVGLPVLSTNITPIRRIVSETECGRVLPSNATPADVARAVTTMKRSDDLDAYARKGGNAVRSTYHWERDAQRALSSIESLVPGEPFAVPTSPP